MKKSRPNFLNCGRWDKLEGICGLVLFPCQDVNHEVAGIGVGRWKGPRKAFGGGQLAGGAMILFMAPERDKAADGPCPPAPKRELGPRPVVRSRGGVAATRSRRAGLSRVRYNAKTRADAAPAGRANAVRPDRQPVPPDNRCKPRPTRPTPAKEAGPATINHASRPFPRIPAWCRPGRLNDR